MEKEDVASLHTRVGDCFPIGGFCPDFSCNQMLLVKAKGREIYGAWAILHVHLLVGKEV